MLPILTYLQFIVDKPRFREERPFAIHVSPNSSYDPSDPRLSSIDFEDRQVAIIDMRILRDVKIAKNGFEHLACTFSPISINDINEKSIETYRVETEDLLKGFLGAEKVICYDHRVGIVYEKTETALLRSIILTRLIGLPLEFTVSNVIKFDELDTLIPDEDDITFENGPKIITTVLESSEQTEWLNRRYRYRIVNTWRPLVPKLEDRPLAVCDFQSVDSNDLIAADQIYGNLRKDIYYLKHNKRQRWYWLSHQTPQELLLMVMYDTRSSSARFCPHASFHNPTADLYAPPRESIETRNVVITLASEE